MPEWSIFGRSSRRINCRLDELGPALKVEDADADGVSWDVREDWVDCVLCGATVDAVNRARQLAARVKKVRNFSASPSYSPIDPQSSSLAEN